ncbi:hypothetical protein [Lacticigenium naphthae]|uniref:hypothetical protein n=1 Tax=Lacticigenium naphthae TaxID=515351 RepID=UPI00040A1088|nr:hypothetical protein [Lacticigenium naphthae]
MMFPNDSWMFPSGGGLFFGVFGLFLYLAVLGLIVYVVMKVIQLKKEHNQILREILDELKKDDWKDL